MSRRDAERGLDAVRRVREARERDSRIGLQQALTTVAEREAAAAAAEDKLFTRAPFHDGPVAAFQAHALFGRALAEDASAKQEQARRSASIADEARRRWARDRQALRMVQLLQERRAAERAAARARREAAELDDLATQGWLRNRPEVTS